MSIVGSLIDKITELIQVKLNQLKVQAGSKAATILSRLVIVLCLAALGFFFLLLLFFGLSFYLNYLLGSQYWGFFIMAGVVLVFILSLFLIGKNGKLQLALEKVIINSFEEDD